MIINPAVDQDFHISVNFAVIIVISMFRIVILFVEAESIFSYSGFRFANRLESPSFIGQTPAGKERGTLFSLAQIRTKRTRLHRSSAFFVIAMSMFTLTPKYSQQ
jgi:hypothetical protein